MFTDVDWVNIVVGGCILVLMLSLYILFNFIKNINDSFIEDEYNANAVHRHNELTDEFLKNRFK